MQQGLQGRRIALVMLRDDADNEQQAGVIRRALEEVGSQVDILKPGRGTEQDWHGARYAGLVVVGGATSDAEPAAAGRITQLAREFQLSEKPIAVLGGAVPVVTQAGAEALVSGHDDTDIREFAARVTRKFSNAFEDRDVDEMSEESFPASDPPSTTPVSKTKVTPEDRAEAG